MITPSLAKDQTFSGFFSPDPFPSHGDLKVENAQIFFQPSNCYVKAAPLNLMYQDQSYYFKTRGEDTVLTMYLKFLE